MTRAEAEWWTDYNRNETGRRVVSKEVLDERDISERGLGVFRAVGFH